MKAMVYHTYGSPDVLHCEEVAKPVPSDDQVLIRVRAAALNALDVGLMKGRPYFARFFFGFPNPKISRPGRDVAGEVEAVGTSVTRFKPGDEVFGACSGKSFDGQSRRGLRRICAYSRNGIGRETGKYHFRTSRFSANRRIDRITGPSR